MKRHLGPRILVTALVAGAFGLGGVVTSTAASASDNDPTGPSGSCVNRQIKEHNGYWFVCENGVWVYQKLGSQAAAQSPDSGTVKPVKPAAPRTTLPPRA